MSGLMKLCGALLLVAAIVLVLMLKLSSAQMQVWGISPDVIATLLVGGVLSLGLSGLIDAVTRQAGSGASAAAELVASAPAAIDEIAVEKPTAKTFGFGRKAFEEPASAAVTVAAAPIIPAVVNAAAVTSVADTIAALEQAKADIKTALGGVETLGDPEPKVLAEKDSSPETVAEAAIVEGELYVVEEKIIRGRPSRILSDDTVEAETDEGWMRFENLEHLNEYLDSVEEGDA